MATADEIRASLNPATAEAAARAIEFAAMQDQLQAVLQALAEAQAKLAPPPPPAEPVAKIYYSQAPFCSMHVMRGPGHCEAVNFIAGSLETKDLQVQAMLDNVVDKPNSGIYSKSPTEVSDDVSTMTADIRAAAILARDKAVRAGLSV